MIKRLLITMVGLSAWGASLFGAISLQNVESLGGHSFCNPLWGCAPPMKELICWHTVMFVAMLLPTVLVFTYLKPTVTRHLFKWAFWIGMLSLIGFVLVDSGGWLVQQEFQNANLLHQRIGFGIARQVDFPIIQFTVLMFSGWMATRLFRTHRNQPVVESPATSNPDAVEPQPVS